MSKSLSTFTADEKDVLIKEIAACYEKNGHPAWLESPKFYTEIVNVLNQGMQQVQEVLQITGKAPLESKEDADKIKKELHQICASVTEKEIEIGCSFGVGVKMGVIENADKVCVDKNMCEGKTNVKHEAGQVLLLDFWATWCPPCQKPMAHNQEMLEKRGGDWGDKVRLLGLSIDQEVNKLKSHVEDKKWMHVEHYWVRNGVCTADNDYGVQGVPHVLLVDTEGVIVFMGHPASRNIEKDIDALLKGEKLTGEGCNSKSEEKVAAGEAGKATIEDLNKFKKDTGLWIKDVKDKAAQLQRAFLVMTCNEVHNCKDASIDLDITCHTVIMGDDKDAIAAVHEECKKHNQGPWKNRDQVQ